MVYLTYYRHGLIESMKCKTEKKAHKAAVRMVENCEGVPVRIDDESGETIYTFETPREKIGLKGVEHYPSINTEAKQDTGKLQIQYVPPAIIESVARVREYGNMKYGDPDNWRTVAWERYFAAMLRHTIAMIRDPMSYDEESGLLHLDHVACNVAFILEIWRGDGKK